MWRRSKVPYPGAVPPFEEYRAVSPADGKDTADKGDGQGLAKWNRQTEKELTLTQGKPCCLVQASITAATPSCDSQAVSSASHRFSVLVLEPPYRFKYLGTNIIHKCLQVTPQPRLRIQIKLNPDRDQFFFYKTMKTALNWKKILDREKLYIYA